MGRSQRPDSGMNAAYHELLAEVESSPTQTGDEGRAIKRRRVHGRIVTQHEHDSIAPESPSTFPKSMNQKHDSPPQRKHNEAASELDAVAEIPTLDISHYNEQTAYNDESSEESDFAWEEVDLTQEPLYADDEEADNEEERDLQLVLNGNGKGDSKEPTASRRKPLTAVERKLRQEVHKLHILCLLSHIHLRNHWCNDQNVHKILYHGLPKSIVSLLNPDEKYPQFRQDESFKGGLKKASDYFRTAFTITARGMSRPHWAEDSENNAPQVPADLDLPMQKSDFLRYAEKHEGSRDVGAQLFCALLRSAGVETRLVCSLQVLPLTTAAKGATPQKPIIKPMPVIDYNPASSEIDSDHHRSSPKPSKRPIGSTGGLTRFANPNPQSPPISVHPPRPPRSKKFRESSQPIFWLEALNPVSQKWTPIDPLVTQTFGKPSTLTPSLSDPLNALTYIIAFNDDLTAKDVTRRYTRSYTSKILKQRVDLTPKGKIWLENVLKLFRYPGRRKTKRDKAEDLELAKKEAAEPMPRAIQDFKNHPTYALERHLRRNEIIHPRNEIGKVNTAGVAGGKNPGTKSESVFRRKDVVVCRSADAWFRLGREIRQGEQPLKRLPPPPHKSTTTRRIARSPFLDNEASDPEEGGKLLYAEHQTQLYTPPPIPPSGRPLPRNAYGNLDIYTPSMIPHRGYHSPHPLTATAAKILGIDYVDAVTGFQYTGKRGKAVITGAVVWEGHRDAVDAVVKGLEEIRETEEEERRRGVVLGVWRRMLLGLRVRERVRGYEVEGERDEVEKEVTAMEEEEEEEDEGGGFVPERGTEDAVPTAGVARPHGEGVRRSRGRRMLVDDDESEDSDIYVPSDGDEEEVLRSSRKSPDQRRTGLERRRYRPDEDSSGGFIREDVEDDGGGGFVPDDNDDDAGGGFIPEHSEHRMKHMNYGDDYESQGSTAPEAQPAHGEENSKPISEGLLEETGLITASRPEVVHQAQSPNLHLAIQPLDPTLASRVSTEEEDKSAAFRIEEHEGDVLGLSDTEVAEATMLQQFYEESAPDQPLPSPEQPEEGQQHKEPREQLMSSKTPQRPPNEEEKGEEDDDKGSLLSEDPSDEDAEPEWLA
ncbi:MAG: hypothetical protein Q9181_002424 [Wetmoreana brouardii]